MQLTLRHVQQHYASSLEGKTALICQHLLRTNQEMIEALFASGLKPKDTYIIGKSYSYNDHIANDLRKQGAHVFEYTYDSHQAFDNLFDNAINRFLNIPQRKENTLIIDDGGALIKKASERADYRIIGAVEQTSSGYHRLQGEKHPFPIMNIARSEAKLHLETQHIVEHALSETNKRLQARGMYIHLPLIIGDGPIGKGLADALHDTYGTRIVGKEEFEQEKERLLRMHGSFFGCTGETSISKEYHDRFHFQVLVSLSSSDREFDAYHLRKQWPRTNDPHADIIANKALLLNSGFPITFRGAEHEVTPENIQLTQALMLAGTYEVLRHQQKNMVGLDQAVQQDIIAAYKSSQ